MKKETIIAIVLGVVAGLGVAVVMLEKAREHQMTNTQAISSNVQLTPKVASNQLQILGISTPDDGSISSQKSTEIKGKASKNALLIVQSPLKTIVQKMDADTFDIKNFPLTLGENIIRVSVYPKGTQTSAQEKELKIYYLDEQ
jgi:hypothetical protein